MAGADANLRYKLDVDGEAGVTAGFRKVADSIDGTEKAMAKAGKGAKRLSDDMDAARRKIAQLREEFDRTGDVGLLKDISREERNVKRLSGWLKTLSDDTVQVSKVSNLLSNHYVMLGAAGTAAMAAPLLGAAVTGAAIAALGVGVIAFGAAGVRESKRVQASMEALGRSSSSTLQRAAGVMEGPFVGALERIRGTVESTEAPLKRMFTGVAPSVDDLADGVDGLAQNALPGLEAGLKGVEPVLEMLGDKLPEVGSEFGEFFDVIGQRGPEAASGLASTLDLVNFMIQNSAAGLAGLTDTWGAFANSPGGAPLVGLLDKIAGSDSGVRSTAVSTSKLAGSVKEVGVQAQAATFWTKSFAQATGLLNNEAIAVESAEIRARDATQSFKDALKASTAALSMNTESSRNARSKLVDQLQAAVAVTDATWDTTHSADAATGAFNRHIGALRNTTRAGSFAREQMDELIGEFVRMQGPTSSSTARVAMLNLQIRLLKDKTVKATADGNWEEVQRLQREINALRNKVVTLTIRTRTIGRGPEALQVSRQGQSAARWMGGPIGFADGGGAVRGPGSSLSDSIPAMLSDGEYVIKASSARKIGLPLLNQLNAVGMASGGVAGNSVNWGQVTPQVWEMLLKAGWRGRAGDKAERLYGSWAQLLRAGWAGNPRDGREMLYPPSKSAAKSAAKPVARPAAAAGGGGQYTINVYALEATRDVGQRVVEAIKQYERGSGAGWRNQ